MADASAAKPETITIKEVEQRKSSKGKPFLRLTSMDDTYYSVWKQDLFSAFSSGGIVDVYVETTTVGDNEFRNIIGIKGGTPTTAPSNSTPRNLPDTNHNVTGVRIAALRAAVELAKAEKITVKKIEETADEFVAYISNNTSKLNTKVTQNEADEYIAGGVE